MKRRELLAGTAGAIVLAGGGAIAVSGPPSLDRDGDSSDSGASHEPRTIETVGVHGSEAGSVLVPDEDHVTFLKFFATTCTTCASMLSDVTDAHSRVSDDVRFLSVTSQTVGPDGQVSEAELAEWWSEHGGGEWSIGTDRTMELQIEYLDTALVPAAAIVDTDGVVQWTHTGRASADELVSEVESVLEA